MQHQRNWGSLVVLARAFPDHAGLQTRVSNGRRSWCYTASTSLIFNLFFGTREKAAAAVEVAAKQVSQAHEGGMEESLNVLLVLHKRDLVVVFNICCLRGRLAT